MKLFDLFKKRILSSAQSPSLSKIVQERKESLPELLSFPYTQLPNGLKGKELMEAWRQADKEGIQPLLIQSDEQLVMLLNDNQWTGGDELPDIQHFLKEGAEDLLDDENYIYRIGKASDRGYAMTELNNVSSKPDADILLAEIPVENPWDIFKKLPVGGWNDCPPAPTIAAFCKLMYDEWGARPVLISGDTLVLKPERIPTAEDAYALALKLYAFCPDLVMQGYESMHALANGLTKSTLWQFWWD